VARRTFTHPALAGTTTITDTDERAEKLLTEGWSEVSVPKEPKGTKTVGLLAAKRSAAAKASQV